MGLLRMHGVTAVADVRSSPYSRHAPQFCIDDLKKALKDAGIAYVFLGKELGARSDKDSCYDGNVVNYQKLSETVEFNSGIDRVVTGSSRYQVALMCSEREPTECHRTILVSKILSEKNIQISHILGNGEIETHEETMLRVVDILGMPRKDLMLSPSEVVAEAYKGREKQIAYRRGE